MLESQGIGKPTAYPRYMYIGCESR